MIPVTVVGFKHFIYEPSSLNTDLAQVEAKCRPPHRSHVRPASCDLSLYFDQVIYYNGRAFENLGSLLENVVPLMFL